MAWQQSIDILQTQLTGTEFSMWIKPLQFIQEGKTWVIYAPNKFVFSRFTQKYHAQLLEILNSRVSGRLPEIAIAVSKSSLLKHNPENNDNKNITITDNQTKSNATTQTSTTTDSINSFVSKSKLNKNYTFANFIEGKSNTFALMSAKQVAEDPAGDHNPLFIYGGVGLGKTHLMQAIGHYWETKYPDINMRYINAQSFVHEFTTAISSNNIKNFQDYYRNLHALLIDDVQFFAEKIKSQEELLNTFNALLDNGQQVILTAVQYPDEIIGLQERLKSRFVSGLIIKVEQPDLETRIEFLLKQASIKKMHISREAALYLAQKITTSIREMQGPFGKVVLNTKYNKTNEISIDIIKEALQDVFDIKDRPVNIEDIQKAVAVYYNVDAKELLTKSRKRVVSRPRQIAMALSRELTSFSIAEIGYNFGKRDHATVIHACKQIKNLKQEHKHILDDYENIKKSLV